MSGLEDQVFIICNTSFWFLHGLEHWGQ
uniref:Phosphate transporter n=1 Tax=Rhizophora mucronata TaxID=61149 RepID=A0A2P2QV43_RHIMU